LYACSYASYNHFIRQLKEQADTVKKDDELSFLSDTTPTKVDEENQLRFEIAKDVYITKKAENEEIRSAKEKKEYNEKITALIQEKREGALKEMTEEQLTALLK
jgi:hypothetical protein